MSEPEKQQIGDGQDNPGQAVGQVAKVAKQAAKEVGKQVAVQGAEATANAAASTVQMATESGKAVAQIAAGAATATPWGAIIAAAWAMRHTLFKVLICICLIELIIVVLICSLPAIIFGGFGGTNGTPPAEDTSLESIYAEQSGAVEAIVQTGYEQAMAEVEQIIVDGNYDYELSMEALINHAQSSAGYDVSYILSAYSASLQQKNTTKEDMINKLSNVTGSMFPVSYVEKEAQRAVPIPYYSYKTVTVTVVTDRRFTGFVNFVPQYAYTTEQRTYYLPDKRVYAEEPVTISFYKGETVKIPVYSGNKITGTKDATYYIPDGSSTLTPMTETVKYAECTISPFDVSVIASAFGMNMDAVYPGFDITYGQVVHNMATSLKMTMYGSLAEGMAVPLTDAEMIAFVKNLQCSQTRKDIIATGLSLVGKVPYFWGGKSSAGWNNAWNTPKLVTAGGSPSTGTVRPFGLDCTGFSDWTFKTALGISLQPEGKGQWSNSYPITAAELLPGDLGFLLTEAGDDWTHVLIFAGYGENGERLWIHSSSGKGVILNSPGYESTLALRRPGNVDFGD